MSVNTQNTFTDEAIRDTNAHNGFTVFNGDFVVKTLIIELFTTVIMMPVDAIVCWRLTFWKASASPLQHENGN